MPRTYAYLRFQSGVDWQDVNKVLLAKLNRLGMRIGKTITVISGYRTYAEQAALYAKYQAGGNIAAKPGQSQHEKGLAVDALIDGQAIGKVVSAAMFKKVGLQSLASIGDAPHVQMPGGKDTAVIGGSSGSQKTSQPQSAADQTQTPGLLPEPPNTLPSPESTIAPALSPGSLQAEDSPKQMQDTWQLLAADPLAQPETVALARRIQQGQMTDAVN